MNKCACGNQLIWLAEIEAGECDACQFRKWWDEWNRWQVELEWKVELEERQAREDEEDEESA